MKTHSCVEEIITSSNEVLKDFQCDMGVGKRKLGTPTRMSDESNDTVKMTAGS